MPVPLSAIVLGLAGTTFIIISNLILYMMEGEVNRKLPEDQQIPYFLPLSLSEIARRMSLSAHYRRFYPNGHLQRIRIALLIVGFGLFLAAFVILDVRLQG